MIANFFQCRSRDIGTNDVRGVPNCSTRRIGVDAGVGGDRIFRKSDGFVNRRFGRVVARKLCEGAFAVKPVPEDAEIFDGRLRRE